MTTLQRTIAPHELPSSNPPVVCCLCNAPASVIGTYEPFPARQAKYRPRLKRIRVYVYGLCLDCSEMPDVLDRVERTADEPIGLAMFGGNG